jgi:hyperosmotically inducible periplasmic protein
MIVPRATTIGILCLSVLVACDGGVRPYRRMGRAARSERNLAVQVDDRLLTEKIRSTLADTEGFGGAEVTPYVYMGHVFLVGFVTHSDQQSEATRAVQDLDGVRSLGAYLPVRTDATKSVSDVASDAAIEGKVKAALVLAGQPVTRIDVQVLAGHVVLLGVVRSQEAVSAATEAARGVSGVTGVTSFLLLPEAGYERLRPGLG